MKRIIDIASPEKFINNSDEKVKSFFKKKNKMPKSKKPKKEKRGKSLVKKFFIEFLILIFLGGAFWVGSLIFSNAEILITLKTEKKEFSEIIKISVNQDLLNIEERALSGRFFETSAEKTEIYQTKNKEEKITKAGGEIIVYNAAEPPRSVHLVENTRFLSSEKGKIFRATEKIYLPPASYSEGELIPSSKKVSVAAQEGGEEYNIGPSNFSVPGLSGTNLYYTIWAESQSAMRGGDIKENAIVKANDLEAARDNLKKSLIDKSYNLLTEKISSGYLLEKEAIFVKNFDYSCSAKEGEMAETFECSGNISVQALAFSSKDIKELAENIVTAELPSEKRLVKGGLEYDFAKKNLNPEEGEGRFEFNLTAKIYRELQEATIKNQVAGMKAKEAKNFIFENYEQVEKVEIRLKPFWVKKLPKSENISVSLTF